MDFFTAEHAKWFYYAVVGIILTVVAILFILEIYLSLNNIPGDNVNYQIKDWAYGKYFFITFFWGIVSGHLFMGSDSPLMRNTTWSVVIVAILVLGVLIAGLRLKNLRVTQAFQLTLLALGAIVGHFIWSMNFNQ